jgi:hypothetical protein
MDAKPANVAPIYFSATSEELPLAATGLLKLEIPRGRDPRRRQSPFVYGPFSHELRGLGVPPAVMLGLSIDGGTAIKHTEDYAFIYTGIDAFFFKPALITPSTFMVHVWDFRDVALERGELINLRWWAIPADQKRSIGGGPIIVEFVPSELFIKAKARVRVTHTNTSADKLRVKLTVDGKKGPIITLRRTDAEAVAPSEETLRRTDAEAHVAPSEEAHVDTSEEAHPGDPDPLETPVYISEEFEILPEQIAFGGDPHTMSFPGLVNGADLVAIYLDERDNEIASGTTHIRE